MNIWRPARVSRDAAVTRIGSYRFPFNAKYKQTRTFNYKGALRTLTCHCCARSPVRGLNEGGA